MLEDPLAGRLRHGRQVHAGDRREIGDERRLAGRHGHHAGPAGADAATHPVAAGQQLGRLDAARRGRAQRMTPVAAKRGVGDPVLAGQGARVREGGHLGLGGPTDLHEGDRLALLERPIGEREEALGALEALHEEDDGVGLGIVQAIGQVVADVEDDLGAAADDPAPADARPRRVDEGIGDRARLGDAGDPASALPRIDVADVGGGVRREVDHPHAVGPEQGDAVLDGDVGGPRPACAGRRRRPRPPRRPG